MKNRIALVALALAASVALGPDLASAQANGPGAPGARMPPIPQVPAMGQPLRDSWYIGFGVGSGVGNLTINGVTRSFGDELRARGTGSPVNFAFQFEVGATVRPDLLVGLDIRALRSQASRDDGFGSSTDLGLQSTQLLAAATWFPAQRGFFVRGGLGIADLTLDSNSNGARASDDYRGVALLGGLGYAFWLGQHFNLTLNADASAQLFGGGTDNPQSARVVDVYLGFNWY